MTTAADHYSVLGVSREASEEEIKRAWAKLVRVYTPDKHPEQNRRINEAKTTLLDTKARAEYDALLDYGEEIEELLEEAEEAREENDWDSAIRAYREILAFHPANHSVRNQLALCQAENDDLDGAIKTLRSLLSKEDGVALYWANLGLILKRKADEADDDRLYAQAEEALGRAIQIEPSNASLYIYLSRIARARKDFKRAEDLVERAIHADGRIDVDDIDLLFELPVIHLLSDNLSALSADAQRIKALIPKGRDELIEYAQYHFLDFAFDLSKRDCHEEAFKFAEVAASIGPLTGTAQELFNALKQGATLISELERLKKDSSMNKAISLAGYIAVAGFFGWQDSAEQRQSIQLVGEALLRWDDETIQGSLSRLKCNYKAIYNLQPEWFSNMRGLGRSPFSSASASGGCCVLPMAATLALFAIALFYIAF